MVPSKTLRTPLRLAAAVAALAGAPGPAQESLPQGPTSTAGASQPIDEVIVRGRRMSEIEFDLRIYIQKFLKDVAKPATGQGYARWDRKVCVGVHNLETTAAQYVVDRISRQAIDLRLEPGEPGCRPQVNIVFATNASETASFMVKSQPRMFRPIAGHAGMNLGRDALDDFVNSERPVRWWHVSLPVGAHTGEPATEMDEGYPTIRVEGASRIHSGIIDKLFDVIIIVDATKLTGTTWQQLGDYLAVVSLAQINPKTNPAEFDSILNLFSNPAAYSGLTDWDRSYLKAIYTFDQERITFLQRNEIVNAIADTELEAR